MASSEVQVTREGTGLADRPAGSRPAQDPVDADLGASPPGFDDVYGALWPVIVRFAQLQCGSFAVGEELAQDAFIGLYRHFARVDSPQAYLRRSVINADSRRRGRAARERVALSGVRDEVTPPPELDGMWQLLTRLPARQRAVLVLRFYEDRPEAEIAVLLGCRPGTVKSLAARGLARLRRELS